MYLGITPGFPVLGMGVFTRIFSIAALLISTVCLAVAEMTVIIPGVMGTIGRWYQYPILLLLIYFIILSLLSSELG